MNRSTPDHASQTSTDWTGVAHRLAYVGYLGSAALCSGLAFVAVCGAGLECVSWAVGAGAVSYALRSVLRSKSTGSDAEILADFSEEEFCNGTENGLSRRSEELANLLHAWSEMERARGSRRFDAWAWQSLRTELRAKLKEDPELRRLLGIGE